MKRNIQYILFFMAVIFTACQDLYSPEIESFSDALVVEGILTDQNEYVTVKLSRSASFSDDSYFYGERKAVVSIESASGNSWGTTEIGRGTYQTNEPVSAIVGEGYYVKIITSGGEEYRSEIEQMMPPTSIGSVFLTDSIFRDLSYNYWGEPVVSDFAGISFAVRPNDTEGESIGYLYKWNALTNYTIYSTAGPAGFNYFCWEELISNSIYVYDYYNDDYIIELPVGDLHSLSYYMLSPLPIDSSRFEGVITTVATTGLYYHLKQYAITKKGAKYWRSVKNQSEASGKLFDPVEEQIYGNIRCVSDSNKIAFGYFNVASYSHLVLGVKLKPEKIGQINIVEFMPQAPSPEDCILNAKPDFWIN